MYKKFYPAIPFRASTGPEQGFPCVVFPHREKPVFNTGFPGDENRFFPMRNTTQGKPCFHYRDGFAVFRTIQHTPKHENVRLRVLVNPTWTGGGLKLAPPLV